MNHIDSVVSYVVVSGCSVLSLRERKRYAGMEESERRGEASRAGAESAGHKQTRHHREAVIRTDLHCDYQTLIALAEPTTTTAALNYTRR